MMEIKEDVTVEGITEDYVWYNSKQLISGMQSWQNQFERMVKVMENRHAEHLKIIDDLIRQNNALKRKLSNKE